MSSRVELGSAPGRLRRRLRSGRQELLLTIAATAAPALLVLVGSAIVRTDGAPSSWRTRIWSAMAEFADVFPDVRDPMDTVGALAGIAVAIIFYNARAELPDPAGETSDEDLERTSTVLRTKSVLRLVAVIIGAACWLLLLANLVRTVAGDRTVVNAVELLALASLIILSCNFVTSQREEIAQRSLLALDAAVSAYAHVRAWVAADNGARSHRSLRRRPVILAAGLLIWFAFAAWNAVEPLTADRVIILAVIGIVPMVLHLAVFALVGELRVPWRRGLPVVGLCLTAVPLVVGYVSAVGMVVAPPAAVPDPRDQVFFTATVGLFLLTAVAFWPIADITANSKARTLRAYIAARESRFGTKV